MSGDTATWASACYIKQSEGKGRGVYASRGIPLQIVVDVSPILYFSKEEYDAHGKHTVLDHYAFECTDGRMALALGLGSIFNHSDTPNVSYTIDTHTDTIRYTTTRLIESDEELCIFYGRNLWFVPDGASNRTIANNLLSLEETLDGCAGLPLTETSESVDHVNLRQSLIEDPSDIIPEHDLPFTRIKLLPDDDEEETLSAIQTIQAWVVDLPDPRHITTVLQWIKRTELGAPELEHLKRVRRQGETSTVLLCTSSEPPELPSDYEHLKPYTLFVPRTSALTPNSLRLKSSLWPTLFTPRRKTEPESWSRGKLAWAWDAIHTILQNAVTARALGELPIVAHVRSPYGAQEDLPLSFTARDTRNSTRHPLRHAVMNIVRDISDYRPHTPSCLHPPSPSDAASTLDLPTNATSVQSGSNYLLTSMTLFITHEPCIMCSMALLHSRVKEVVYLVPMEKTGGCGSLACLPRLDGVNHRFSICRWSLDTLDFGALEIDSHMDA